MAKGIKAVLSGMDELEQRLVGEMVSPRGRVIERAREAFDEGIERTRHFDDALAHVLWEGYLMGKEAAPKRKSRAKATNNKAEAKAEASPAWGEAKP